MASLQPHRILSDQCQLIEELFVLTAILNQCGLAVFGSGETEGVNILPPKSYIENSSAKTIQTYLNRHGARMNENLLDFHDNWEDAENLHLTFRSGVNSEIVDKIEQSDINVLARGLVGYGEEQAGQYKVVAQQTHLYVNKNADSVNQICDLAASLNTPERSYNSLIPNQKNFLLLRSTAEKNAAKPKCMGKNFPTHVATVRRAFKALTSVKCLGINHACYR